MKSWLFPWYLLQARKAFAEGKRRGLPGLGYDQYGRRLGMRLALRGMKGARRLILQPVDILRYFEFDFVERSLGEMSGRALDISSPSLFALYHADRDRELDVTMINPDRRDLEWTRAVADRLSIRIRTKTCSIGEIPSDHGRFSRIWSISVLEHICGDGNDGAALKKMWDLLEPGGHLAVTVMTNCRHLDEYVESDVYGLGLKREAEGFFFQRLYDETSIRERLLSGIPETAVASIEWYGEKTPGRYAAFVERARNGFDYRWAVEEPREVVDHYQRYQSFSEMPGVGVCGIALTRPCE